jgi:hypothetical protein
VLTVRAAARPWLKVKHRRKLMREHGRDNSRREHRSRNNGEHGEHALIVMVIGKAAGIITDAVTVRDRNNNGEQGEERGQRRKWQPPGPSGPE